MDLPNGTASICHVYGFSGKNSVAVVMSEGVAADLDLPPSITAETREAIRASHIFSPTKMVIWEPVVWVSHKRAFECACLSIPPV